MELDFDQQNCVPAKSIKRAFTQKEARVLARTLPKGWVLSNDAKSLSKEFRFKGFRDAIRFVNVVADLVDAEKHYPQLHIGPKSLRVVLSTPHVNGVSSNDFVLAKKLGQIGRAQRKLI